MQSRNSILEENKETVYVAAALCLTVTVWLVLFLKEMFRK
jgi:hypothetical protein